MEAIARVIHLLGKLGIALRTHRDDISDENNENPGHFLMLIQQIAIYNPVLAEHLNTPLSKNATYLSPLSQNELIEVIGINTIQHELIEEIKRAIFFSIMADEVTTYNEEMLSMCFRYVDDNDDIREVFLEFLELERITGVEIGNKILTFFEKKGIDIKNLRGQCYDGAPNMKLEKVGVSGIILEKSPNACVTHCCAHNLNLSLAQCSNIQVINNIVE